MASVLSSRPVPHEVRLLRSEPVAEGTMAFYFDRPAGFEYQAGQNAQISLLDAKEFDGFGPTRTFTFASAPHERELMVATRMRDTAFKRTLKSAKPGLRVGVDGPNGLMVLHGDPTRPAVFIAGGIGVTPFLSMARHAAHARLPHRLWLFYSNRRPEDAAFLKELSELERSHPNFHFVPTMTEMEKSASKWTGETGVINKGLLERHLRDVERPIYYLAGPPGLVMGMQSVLEGLGVPLEDIRDEEFYGY
jgi:ferredoxin-NADP reductase